jgi:hypothetical protein
LFLVHEADHEFFEGAHRLLQLRHPRRLDGDLAKVGMIDLGQIAGSDRQHPRERRHERNRSSR